MITSGWRLAVVLLLALTLSCQALAAPNPQVATPTKGPPPTPLPRVPNPRELEKWNPPPTIAHLECWPQKDELTPEERAVAIPPASQDRRVKELLAGKRYRFHSAESIDLRLWLDRPKWEEPPFPPGWRQDACGLVISVRQVAEVRYFNYTDNVAVAARVDMTTGEVTQVDTRPGEQVLIGEEERQIAARLAQADPRVQAGGDGQPFTVSGVRLEPQFPPPALQPGPKRRLAFVLLNAKSDAAQFAALVWVDLLSEQVAMVQINRYPR